MDARWCRGSSPRMRGTPTHAHARCGCFGLIPTYAGNTTRSKQLNHSNKAHPHVCGEHSVWFAALRGWLGSSPRMRGTRRPRTIRSGRPRLIPTYAGNTGCSAGVSKSSAAHPHVCGEHFTQLKRSAGTHGSSPRMRGTLSTVGFTMPPVRLIPTYAGNTHASRAHIHASQAHPHVCGEHLDSRRLSHVGRGSSPRMRGTL